MRRCPSRIKSPSFCLHSLPPSDFKPVTLRLKAPASNPIFESISATPGQVSKPAHRGRRSHAERRLWLATVYACGLSQVCPCDYSQTFFSQGVWVRYLGWIRGKMWSILFAKSNTQYFIIPWAKAGTGCSGFSMNCGAIWTEEYLLYFYFSVSVYTGWKYLCCSQSCILYYYKHFISGLFWFLTPQHLAMMVHAYMLLFALAVRICTFLYFL